MTQQAERPLKAILFAGSRRLFLLAALGALAGAGWAWGMIALTGAARVGSSEVLASALRNGAFDAALVGAAAGAVFALVTIVLRIAAPRLAVALSPAGLIAAARNERSGPWPYIVIQFLGLAVLAVGLLFRLPGRTVIIGPIAGAVAACVLFALIRVIARRLPAGKDALLEGIVAGLLGSSLYLALFHHAMSAWVPGLVHKTLRMGANPEAEPFVLALLLGTGIAFLLVMHRTTATARLRASGRPGLPIGIPSALLLALVLVLLAIVPAEPEPSFAPRNPKNVVVIGIDTLRFDRANLLADAVTGTGRDLTPHLRRLAGRGVVFEKAFSQSSWTLPSFGSIMTGKYPQEHKAYPLLGELKGRQVTLAEILKESGYRTGGVVSHFVIGSERGFHQGYDSFDESLAFDYRRITSGQVTDKALAFLEEESDKPFFLFAHYFDPHYSFRDHEGYDFADGYEGWRKERLHDYNAMQTQRHFLDEKDMTYIKDLYEEEVAYTDEQIGRLLERIAAMGLEEETAVIVVADHGEEFMERGWIGHTMSLHDELVHVPLVAVLPGQEVASRTVVEPVETRAIFHTVLDYIGVAHETLDRRQSLLAWTRILPEGRERQPPQDVYSAVWLPFAVWGSGKQVQMMSVRSGRWKLIHDRTCQRDSLFDIVDDPGELTNVVADHPNVHEELLDKLKAWGEELLSESFIGEGGGGPLGGSDERARMKETGYL